MSDDDEQKHADEVRYALRLKAEGKVRPGAECKGCGEWHTRLLQCVDGVRTWAPTCTPTCREGLEVREALRLKLTGDLTAAQAVTFSKIALGKPRP